MSSKLMAFIFFTFLTFTHAYSWVRINNFNVHSIRSSTVTPPKPKIVPGKISVPPPINLPGDLFKTSKDSEKEFEDMINSNNFIVILYNDPVNKRLYVQEVLMQTFNWDENRANGVMMQAHTYGLAIAGEWYKELAVDYAQQLVSKGLVAEAKPSGEGGDDGESS